MKLSHTPGRWFFTASDTDGTMITSGSDRIALWPSVGGTVQQCANARLIAAAPDLLAALQTLAKAVNSSNYFAVQSAFDGGYASAAISNATGESLPCTK